MKKKRQLLSEALKTKEVNVEGAAQNAFILGVIIDDVLKYLVSADAYEQYGEFFSAFSIFCKSCQSVEFLDTNADELFTSLELFGECIEELKDFVKSKEFASVSETVDDIRKIRKEVLQ